MEDGQGALGSLAALLTPEEQAVLADQGIDAPGIPGQLVVWQYPGIAENDDQGLEVLEDVSAAFRQRIPRAMNRDGSREGRRNADGMVTLRQ